MRCLKPHGRIDLSASRMPLISSRLMVSISTRTLLVSLGKRPCALSCRTTKKQGAFCRCIALKEVVAMTVTFPTPPSAWAVSVKTTGNGVCRRVYWPTKLMHSQPVQCSLRTP
eukprot:scaffold18269_cov71-Phaeocystis_antarctica.AAC.12